MREFLLSVHPAIKTLHVIAVIAWIAGMMYLPRLFLYHCQSAPGGEAERFFAVMERRLLKGIANPAMIAVWALGGLMLYAQPAILGSTWFHIKFAAVLGVSAVHGFYSRSSKAFAAGARPRGERFWRVMNEIPFLLVIVAVFMVIAKPF